MELNRIIHSVQLLTAGVILTSCIEVNGSGYSDLSESEKLHVKKCEVPLDSITNDGNLYKVSVKQVSDYIKKHQRVLVYEYLPFCSGVNGISPIEIKRYCEKHHINLVVISSVYDGIFPIPSSYTFPIFVIDNSINSSLKFEIMAKQLYVASQRVL